MCRNVCHDAEEQGVDIQRVPLVVLTVYKLGKRLFQFVVFILIRGELAGKTCIFVKGCRGGPVKIDVNIAPRVIDVLIIAHFRFGRNDEDLARFHRILLPVHLQNSLSRKHAVHEIVRVIVVYHFQRGREFFVPAVVNGDVGVVRTVHVVVIKAGFLLRKFFQNIACHRFPPAACLTKSCDAPAQ